MRKEILEHYAKGLEDKRLQNGIGQLELLRTREVIQRYLPPPPAKMLDVGGGSCIHGLWLANLDYEVHLVDPIPLHIEQAKAASKKQKGHSLASITEGNALKLEQPDNTMDGVFLLGPLYHLTDRAERIAALKEAYRVLRPGKSVFIAVISRFASALDGIFRLFMDDPDFTRIMERDLISGQHRNLTGNPLYFTTAFFHHAEELKSEVQESGLQLDSVFGLEGPAWLLQNFDEQWNDVGRRDRLLTVIRTLETEPTVIGVSAHILGVAKKPR